MVPRRATVLLVLVLAGCLGHGATRPAPTVSSGPASAWTIDAHGNGKPIAPPGHISVLATGLDAGEPSMGVDSKGRVFVVGDNVVARSADRGATWDRVYDFRKDAAGVTARDGVDAWLWHDPVTDRIYLSELVQGACTSLAWTDDAGATWTERDGACSSSPIDHQKFFTAPPPAGNPAAGRAFPSVGYLCYGILGTVFANVCSVTLDGGLTFGAPVDVMDRVRHGCGGLGAIGVGLPDGTAILASGYDCKGPTVAVTLNAGLGWSVRSGPTSVGSQAMDPDLAADAQGNVYVVWEAIDNATYLARSPDAGVTWRGPWRVTPPGVHTTAFPAVSVAGDGTVYVGFLGAQETRSPATATEAAIWHVYVVASRDAATADEPSFVARRATPSDDPAQAGQICFVNQACSAGHRNLLEFNDAAVGPDGSFYYTYADGCVDACAAAPSAAGSVSHAIHVARWDA